MKILYYDNCWFTNVGEAFIDIGAIQFLKKLFPGAQIATISNMSNYYVPSNRRKFPFEKKTSIDNKFCLNDILDMWDFDLLVLAGMFMSETHLNGKVCEFVKLAASSKKVAFCGLGEDNLISEAGIENFKEYISELNPLFITTRDKKTYAHLGGSIEGLDAAFWVKDAFNPKGFSKNAYDIVAFNRTPEPNRFERWDVPIVRPYHMQWVAQTRKFSDRTFISDSPLDYISLYANSRNVYTDLVHATIISLQFGKKVQYYYVDSRSDTFNDLEIIKKDENGAIYIADEDLEIKKSRLVEEVKMFIGR